MFYGWTLLGFLWLMSIATTAGSAVAWGFYAKEVMAELDMTAAKIGAVSGFAVITYSVLSPITGFLIARFGTRIVMTVGCAVAACGCAVIATSQGFWQFVLGFSVLVSAGGVMHVTLPSQTLVTNWFDKYRARVLAVLSTSVAVGGFIWLRLHNEIVQVFDWRTGWWIAACLQASLVVLTPLVIRNRPEDIGQGPDGTGAPSSTVPDAAPVSSSQPNPITRETIFAVVTSPQFIFLVFLSVAAVAPNGLVLVHGRLHLESLGLSQTEAVSILSIASLIGLTGRLSSGIADFISPKPILFIALGLEAAGTFGLIFASTPLIGYVSIIAMGVGFGAGFQIITLLMGRYFGREIFSATQGLRTAAGGTFTAIIPWAVGLSADRTGSYTIALVAESGALVTLVVLAVLFMPSPESQNAYK